MPPCYIDDGTSYTYGDQAKELAARLEELDVEHELHILEGEPHSFDTTDSEAARESLDLQIAFMDHFTRWKVYRGYYRRRYRILKPAVQSLPWPSASPIPMYWQTGTDERKVQDEAC